MNLKVIHKLMLVLFIAQVLPIISYSHSVVDMAGRTVILPDNIKRVISYDPKTSLILFPVAADLLVAKAKMPSKKKIVKISPEYNKIPLVDIKSFEEIFIASPDIIIGGIYVNKDSHLKFDKLQKKLKIPCVVIDLSIDKMDKTYEFLGQLLGVEKEALKLSKYLKSIYNSNDSLMSANPLKDDIAIYYTLGGAGLMTDPSGSKHTEVFDLLKIPNAAKIDIPSGGHAKVNIEQVIAWNPTHIFSSNFRATKSAYKMMKNSPQWSSIKAVEDGKVFNVPDQPYGWIDHPPSVNRIAGIIWLDHIFYKDSIVSMKNKIIELYDLFYKYHLSDKEYERLF